MKEESQNETETADIDIDIEDCLVIDNGALDKAFQAQRVVGLEERRLDAAIQELLRFESETHYAADVLRTKRLVVTIIQLCYEARAWKALNEQIILLSQREAQPKQAIVAMVQRAASYLEDTPDLDTRNMLVETLNNVCIGKIVLAGLDVANHYDIKLKELREVFQGNVVLTSNGCKQTCQTKACTVDSNLYELDFTCNRSQEQAPRNMQKEIEDIQQPLMELVVAPSVESRPSTPPPQPGNRTREMPPSVCRLPVRKGANLVRKPLRPVRRRLFDPPSPAEVEDFLSGLEQRDQRRFIDRYNFDPIKDEPLPGRFEWIPVRPQLTRTTSIDSSNEIRRPELASTLSV